MYIQRALKFNQRGQTVLAVQRDVYGGLQKDDSYMGFESIKDLPDTCFWMGSLGVAANYLLKS